VPRRRRLPPPRAPESSRTRALPAARSAPADGRRGAGGSCTDRGAATLELVVLFPVLLLIIFGVIQGALYYHGRNVVLAAAEQGVRAGRTDGAGDPAAVAAAQARQLLTDTGELDNLTALVIVPTVAGDRLTVTVTARTVSLLPGLPGPQVSQSASGSLERFTSPSAP
jgi:Flp pilus assembly protein TadG